MGLINDYLNSFRKSEQGSAIVISSPSGDIIRTIKCPAESVDNVYAMFYRDYSPSSGKASKLNDCQLEIYSNVIINKPQKGSFIDIDSNTVSKPKTIYAPEALFLADREFQAVKDALSPFEINDRIRSVISRLYPDDLSYIYDEYKQFLDNNDLKDTQRPADFYILVAENLPDLTVIPENARNEDVYRAASRNGVSLGFLPSEYLTFETFKNKEMPIDQRFSRLEDFNRELQAKRGTGISKSELLDIISYSRLNKDSLSLEQCLNALPKSMQGLINAHDIKEHLINDMKDFISIRFKRGEDGDMSIYGEPSWFEYYENANVPNPINSYPEIELSARDWHDLCSINTELISEGYVPKSVLEDRNFWEKYTNLIGKGDYLANPDKEPFETFDEAKVFSHMPMEMRNDPEVQKTLLSSGAVSTYFFGNSLSQDIWKSVTPSEYKIIPNELRRKEEFRNTGIQAVKANIQNISHLPSQFIENWMIDKILKEDMSLLTFIPDKKIMAVPDIEQKMLDAVLNYRQQNIFHSSDLPGEYGLVAVEQEEAKEMLRHIPMNLRTETICKAAVQISDKNRYFVPEDIHIKADRSDFNENCKSFKCHR